MTGFIVEIFRRTPMPLRANTALLLGHIQFDSSVKVIRASMCTLCVCESCLCYVLHCKIPGTYCIVVICLHMQHI